MITQAGKSLLMKYDENKDGVLDNSELENIRYDADSMPIAE
jgi:hypothetical protein